MRILVTVGARFIDANFVYYTLKNRPNYGIICMDSLTCAGNLSILEKSEPGQVYSVGGRSEMRSIDIVRLLCARLGKQESLISFVADRKVRHRPGKDTCPAWLGTRDPLRQGAGKDRPAVSGQLPLVGRDHLRRIQKLLSAYVRRALSVLWEEHL